MIGGVPHEVFALLGIGVVGYIGNSVLIQLGQKHLAVAFDIVMMIAGMIVGMKFFSDGMDKVKTVLNHMHF